MMRKSLLLLLFVLVGFANCYNVPPGYVGVLVKTYGTEKGVNEQELGIGRGWEGIGETVYLFPTFTNTYVWTKGIDTSSPTDESIEFQTKKGLPINADVGIQFTIEKTKANSLFKTYRRGVEEIVDTVLRVATQNAINKYSSNMSEDSIYGEGRIKLLTQAQEDLKKEFFEQGILIERLYWIGRLRMPQEIEDAIIEKVASVQKAERKNNEILEAKAEEQIAIIQARITRLEGKNLTPLLIQQKFLSTWNGEMPLVVSPQFLGQFSFGAIGEKTKK